MEETNIYDDLDDFTLDQRVEQVNEDTKELLQTIEKLEETSKKFQDEISDLKKINHNLERNISALFKTAKSEIERKDKQIAVLRRELDNFKFRRNKKQAPEPSDNLIKEMKKADATIQQKNRIIQSLTKELESVKKNLSIQENNLKRNHEDDLRDRLPKKRKFDDLKIRDHGRRARSRSRSRPRDDRSERRFDKKRSRRRSRSRSRSFDNNNKIESRARSTEKYKHLRKPLVQQEMKSRSRSSSIEIKEVEKKVKCDKIINNHLMKDDSGISSSNSHTSEQVNVTKSEVKPSESVKPQIVEDLEEGEIDCSLEDINSDEDNSLFKDLSKKVEEKPNVQDSNKTQNKHENKINQIFTELDANKLKDDVLELMVQSDYLDDFEDDGLKTKIHKKKKKRKEDKEKMSQLRTAISECKQNIELLEHDIYRDRDDESETENEFNKTGVSEKAQTDLVLKICKGTIVKPKTVNLVEEKTVHLVEEKTVHLVEEKTEEIAQEKTEEIAERSFNSERELFEAVSNIIDPKIFENPNVSESLINEENEQVVVNSESPINNVVSTSLINLPIEPVTVDNIEIKLKELFEIDEVEVEKKVETCNIPTTSKEPEIIPVTNNNNSVNEIVRKPPLKTKRRRAFICIT